MNQRLEYQALEKALPTYHFFKHLNIYYGSTKSLNDVPISNPQAKFLDNIPSFSGENENTDYEKAIYLARDSVYVGHLGTLFMKH